VASPRPPRALVIRIPGWRKFAYGLIVCAGVLVIAEVGLHFTCGPVDRPYLTREGLPPGVELPYRLAPGPHEACVVNSMGVWGDEVEVPRPPQILRVAAVGGSSTQGCCPCETASASYPAQLRLLLGDRPIGGLEVEIVNAGIEGFHATNVCEWLRVGVLPLEPDVVLVYSGWNDIAGVDVDFGNLGKWSDPLVERSALAHEIARIVYAAHQHRVSMEDSAKGRYRDHVPTRFVESLRCIVDTCRAFGARPVLMTQASNLRPDMPAAAARREVLVPVGLGSADDLVDLWVVYRRHTQQVAEEMDVDFIDTVGAMQRPDADELMEDHMHPEAEGYRVLAEWIAPRLIPVLEDVAASRVNEEP